jgi:large subunit ribosomal protein L32
MACICNLLFKFLFLVFLSIVRGTCSMPVPKKRVGKSDKRHRRANWKAFLPGLTACPHCGVTRHPHTMCVSCGFYRGEVMSQKLHAHHEH